MGYSRGYGQYSYSAAIAKDSVAPPATDRWKEIERERLAALGIKGGLVDLPDHLSSDTHSSKQSR